MSSVVGHTTRKRRVAPIEFTCKECRNPFLVYPSRLKQGIPSFCSQKCHGKHRQGETRSTEWKEKISVKLRGRIISLEARELISKALIGKPGTPSRFKGIKLPWVSESNRLRTGEKAANWRGGRVSENQRIRHSEEFRQWREAVFIRDNWTCQKYGGRGRRLQAHHILNFSTYPELRFDVGNGVTLSVRAHREFHRIYGTKNNTREQLQEFLRA